MINSITVWVSCGAASAVAAKFTRERHPHAAIRMVNNPVAEEDPDNMRFLLDVQEWLGTPIEFCVNPSYPDASCEVVWDQRSFMSGPEGAPCTYELKKRARQLWERDNPSDAIVLGFTAEEAHRYERFKLTERDDILPVLIDAGVTKQDCYEIIQRAGLDLPRIYHMGYPNANCVGCVKATSPTYWNHVRAQHPDVFERRAEQSRRIGAKLVRVKNERIYLDELDPDAKGRPMKSADLECGIFCEETDDE